MEGGSEGTVMKVLMYCQHVLGIGHLVRSTEIARALSREGDVTFVSGGAPVDGFPFPPGVRLVQLPPIQTDDEFGALENCGCAQDIEELQDLRREQLLALFNEFVPQVLVIELFPFGRKRFAFELLPLLECARQRDGATSERERNCVSRERFVGRELRVSGVYGLVTHVRYFTPGPATDFAPGRSSVRRV